MLLGPVWLVIKLEKKYLHSTSVHLLELRDQKSEILIVYLKESWKARQLHQSLLYLRE